MKKGRHQIIIELIRKYEIENQNELSEKLSEMGLNVTQATISRDIQKLGLIKIKSEGKFKYAVIESPDSFSDKYVRIVRETIKDLKLAKNILVIKTQSGMAMATAAGLDGLSFDEVIGSIAGDDVIFVATADEEKAMLLKNKLEVIIRKEN